MAQSTNAVCFIADGADENEIKGLSDKFRITYGKPADGGPYLRLDAGGLALVCGSQAMYGDFSRLKRRISRSNLNRETLIKAARIKGRSDGLTLLDATAGMGEDAFLLAADGFSVALYERDPVIAALLQDTMRRAAKTPELGSVTDKMRFFEQDSVIAMSTTENAPDVVLLDPMFPSRHKSGLIKKKFQLLQLLESPCSDENELMDAAIACRPKKIVVKRPSDAPFLGGRKPDYSVNGSTIRYDCIVP